MCGIAGICQIDATPLTPEAGQWVKAMTDRMAHRGPDGEGQWSHGPVCLGHRRLSIIDLSGGGQPMHSADGQLTVTFNGEIYNYAELKEQLTALGGRFQTSSDTEVILEGYRIWGPDCLARFDGMFAFALWDNQQRRLFCARDRFGKKPFFYTVQQGQLHFASELTALEKIPGLSLTMQPEAVMRYLAYEYVPTPQTVYGEVESLPPAHWLMIEGGAVRTGRYWDMPMPDEARKAKPNHKAHRGLSLDDITEKEAPEQARGEKVDNRSDIYSVGCLLYELLTSQPLFKGDSPVSVAYQHVREAPVPPSQIDDEITPAMDAIVLKSLSKDPRDRYQDASEFRDDILRVLNNQPVLAALPVEPPTQVIHNDPMTTTARRGVVAAVHRAGHHPAHVGVHHRHPLEVDVGVLELRDDVVGVVGHAGKDGVNHR